MKIKELPVLVSLKTSQEETPVFFSQKNWVKRTSSYESSSYLMFFQNFMRTAVTYKTTRVLFYV
jgi:hypothetical protein